MLDFWIYWHVKLVVKTQKMILKKYLDFLMMTNKDILLLKYFLLIKNLRRIAKELGENIDE